MNKNEVIGFLTFGIGIGLLLFTFYTGYKILTEPKIILPFSELVPLPQTTGIGEIIVPIIKIAIYIIPIGLLSIMGSIGGRIVKYGIVLLRTKKEPKTPGN
jgi:type III secretory pathway component EscU